ncbi:MAG: hypothetical protein ACT4UQ_08925 [Gammaproteobacteria bacterium]
MGTTFQEKSLWLMLAALVACFGAYFAAVLPARSSVVLPDQVALFIAAVVALVLIQIAGHIAIAIVDRRRETDERGRLIELKGTRIAAWVLATGVFGALCVALVADGNFAFTHLLLGSWVLAEMAGIVAKLVLYRRGT